MSVSEACPDTGACHHDCPLDDAGKGLPCWRVGTCVPLGIAKYPADRWPVEVVRTHAGQDAADRVVLTERLALAIHDVVCADGPCVPHQNDWLAVADQALATVAQQRQDATP